MTTTNEGGAAPQRRALICGVGGQDGAYLTRFHLAKYHGIAGTSRHAAKAYRGGLRQPGVEEHERMISLGATWGTVCSTLRKLFDATEIYDLARQTSVGLLLQAQHDDDRMIGEMCLAAQTASSHSA